MKYEVTGAVNRLGRAEEVDEVDLGNFAERGSMGTRAWIISKVKEGCLELQTLGGS